MPFTILPSLLKSDFPAPPDLHSASLDVVSFSLSYMQLSMNARGPHFNHWQQLLQNVPILTGGGPDWTRTSDPRLIKAVL
jgi:hypothetical protein